MNTQYNTLCGFHSDFLNGNRTCVREYLRSVLTICTFRNVPLYLVEGTLDRYGTNIMISRTFTKIQFLSVKVIFLSTLMSIFEEVEIHILPYI